MSKRYELRKHNSGVMIFDTKENKALEFNLSSLIIIINALNFSESFLETLSDAEIEVDKPL